MILVLGATGTVGREVVRLLGEAGAPFRALVRSPDRARALFGPLVPLVPGDLDRPEGLEDALAGVERAFLASPVDPRQTARETALIRAAARQGMRHVVKLSNLGADPSSGFLVARWHGEIERALTGSGMALTFLRPHYFMQNLLRLLPALRAEGVLGGAFGEGRISLVDARDVAAVATAALTAPGHEGRAYELTGPEALSFTEIAAHLAEALGRPVRYEALSPEAGRARMIAEGRAPWHAEALLHLFADYAAGRCAAVSPAVAQATGRPATSLRRFLQDHAALLQAG